MDTSERSSNKLLSRTVAIWRTLVVLSLLSSLTSQASPGSPVPQPPPIPIASLASSPRRGAWEPGVQESGSVSQAISAYVQMTRGTSPNTVKVRVRLEGDTAANASVRFYVSDGCRFEADDHRTEWQLRPDGPSEIMLTIDTLKGDGQLRVETNQRAERGTQAFALKVGAQPIKP